jgi:hypothetical protein
MHVETRKEEWMRWIKGPNYRILLIEGVDELDPIDDNVDVEILFDDGRRYGATLFTLENVHSLMERYRSSGECGGGSYFWASQMIMVRSLTPAAIAEAIGALIAEGDLDQAFVRYADEGKDETARQLDLPGTL